MRHRDCGWRIAECGLAMNQDDFKKRTKAFALRIIRLAESLPDTPTARAIRSQIIRSGSAVGANYRAACRAKSKPDFISKWERLKRKPMKRFTGWNY